MIAIVKSLSKHLLVVASYLALRKVYDGLDQPTRDQIVFWMIEFLGMFLIFILSLATVIWFYRKEIKSAIRLKMIDTVQNYTVVNGELIPKITVLTDTEGASNIENFKKVNQLE